MNDAVADRWAELFAARRSRRAAGVLAAGTGAALGLSAKADATHRSRRRRRLRRRRAGQSVGPAFRFATAWGSRGDDNGEFHNPRGIAVDSAGTVYVLDVADERVQTFTPTGGFLTTWGGGGNGPGQFVEPQAIAINPADNLVYVLDSGNARVQKFVPT